MTQREHEYSEIQSSVLEFISGGSGEFAALACSIYAFQFRHNVIYRKFCEARGLGEKIADWAIIPPVPQQAFKSSVLTTFPNKTAVAEFRTSGTTGEGYGSHFFQDLSLYDAAIQFGWKNLELPALQKFVLTPSPRHAPHSSLSYMMGSLVQNNDDAFFWEENALEEARLRKEVKQAVEAGKPVLLLGTALAFLNLMEKSRQPLMLPPGSYLLETGGYKGSGRDLAKNDFYAQLSAFFSLSIDKMINEYGMTELSSQFYAFGLDQPHQSGKWIRHRIIDPLTNQPVGLGETGILQLFDLANVGSVLAVQTEDLAIARDGGFILLGRDPAATARGCSRSADELLNR